MFFLYSTSDTPQASLTSLEPINIVMTKVLPDGYGDISHFVHYANAMHWRNQFFILTFIDKGKAYEDKVRFFNQICGTNSVLSEAKKSQQLFIIQDQSSNDWQDILLKQIPSIKVQNAIITCVSTPGLESHGIKFDNCRLDTTETGPSHLKARLITYVTEHGGNEPSKDALVHSNPFIRILGFPGKPGRSFQNALLPMHEKREGVFIPHIAQPQKPTDEIVVSWYTNDIKSLAFFMACFDESPLKKKIHFKIVSKDGGFKEEIGTLIRGKQVDFLDQMAPEEYLKLISPSHFSICKPDASLEDAIGAYAFPLFHCIDGSKKDTDGHLVECLEKEKPKFEKTRQLLNALYQSRAACSEIWFKILQQEKDARAYEALMALMHKARQQRGKTTVLTAPPDETKMLTEAGLANWQQQCIPHVQKYSTLLTEDALTEWQQGVVPWLKDRFNVFPMIPLWEDQKMAIYHAIFDETLEQRSQVTKKLLEDLVQEELEGLCSILLLYVPTWRDPTPRLSGPMPSVCQPFLMTELNRLFSKFGSVALSQIGLNFLKKDSRATHLLKNREALIGIPNKSFVRIILLFAKAFKVS